ncbi:MAG: glycoside hydrolase family 31 protein, partial [Angelakisella sp.]
GEEAHNAYPNSYVGAYHTFLEQTAGQGKGVTFSRAGFTGGQQYPIHWAGDQISSWSELRGQLTAGLSLGLSGVPFWGFDIGGFANAMPTAELYLRATAFAAFAPIMQFHSEPRSGQFYSTQREDWNNDRSPWNVARVSKDDRVVPLYRLYANLRMNLLPYLYCEAIYCAQTARPMMAHLLYDYPRDARVWQLEDEYLLGRNILVAPMITKDATRRQVYLPKGGWYDLWNGCPLDGGREICAVCGLEQIPIYLREGGIVPLNLNHALCAGSSDGKAAMPNCTDRYEEFCLLHYGNGSTDFADDLGFHGRLTVTDGTYTLEGELPQRLTLLPLEHCPPKRFVRNGQAVTAAPVPVELFGRRYKGYRLAAESR